MRLQKQAGVSLLCVMTVLFMFSSLAILFVHNASLDQAGSDAYSYKCAARLVCEAGFQMTLAQLEGSFRNQTWYTKNRGQNLPIWYYGGDDANQNEQLDQDLSNNIWEDDINHDGTLDCPLKDAVRPSFSSALYPVPEGHPLAAKYYSGQVGDENLYRTSQRRNLYALKVEDLSGKIGIPESLPAPEANFEEHKGVSRMLDTLAKWYKKSPSPHRDSSVEPTAVAQNTIEQYWKEAHKLGPEAWERLSCFLTEHCWLDQSVVEPPDRGTLTPYDVVPESVAPSNLFPKINFAAKPVKLKENITIQEPIRYTRINQTARAPVNINTASEPVLIACLNGLLGRLVIPGKLTVDEKTKLAKNEPDSLEVVQIDYEMAEIIAKAIIKQRYLSRFQSWKDFAAFLGKLIRHDENILPKPLPVSFLFTIHHAALVWANANPNSNIAKFHPDFPDSYLYTVWTQAQEEVGQSEPMVRMDKTDLLVYTTEFCFNPTGYFEIESFGRVIDQGAILGESSQKIIVKLFEIEKQTTQSDFLKNGSVGSRAYIYPALSSNLTVASPTAASLCDYDGYISLKPLSQPMNSALYSAFQPVPPKNEASTSYTYTYPPEGGGYKKASTQAESSLQQADGVFLSKQYVPIEAGRMSSLTEIVYPWDKNSPHVKTFVCCWYKPAWDINDAWARPHSILEANDKYKMNIKDAVIECDSYFQLYSQSQNLNGQNEARWSLFAWDVDGSNSYLPFNPVIDLPPNLSVNRWIFIGVEWSGKHLRLRLNEQAFDYGIRYQHLHYVSFSSRWPDIQGSLWFENRKIYQTKQDKHTESEWKKLYNLELYNFYQYFNIFEDYHNSSNRDLLKAVYLHILLKRINALASLPPPLPDMEQKEKNVLEATVDLIKNATSSKKIQTIIDSIKIDGQAFPLAIYFFPTYEASIRKLTPKQEGDPIIPETELPSVVLGRQIRLGSEIKLLQIEALADYYQKLRAYLEALQQQNQDNPPPMPPFPLPPKNQSLPSQSDGVYAHLMADKTLEDDILREIYQKGRYEQKSPLDGEVDYRGKITLPTPSQKNITLGSVCWTEYLPCDPPDMQGMGQNVQTTITLSGTPSGTPSGEKWSKACQEGTGSPLKQELSGNTVFYSVHWMIPKDSNNPLLAAPMLDDIVPK